MTSYTELARKIIEEYCPPEARGGAFINSKMLEDDIAQALQAMREKTIDEIAKTIKNIPSISLGGETYEIISQIVEIIRGLK